MMAFPTRRVRRRAPLPWLLMAVLLAAGCLDDRGLGPDGPSARLALRAQLGALAVSAVRLEGAYLRSDGSSGALGTQQLSLPAGSAPGTSVQLPVTLDLAACLADPLSSPGGGACTVTLTLVLLDGARELDRVIVGPLVLRPGETSTPAPVQLREAASVEVTASSASPLLPGQTVQLAARLLDATGAELAGRDFAWASGTPAVATVDAATGLVTAVAPGTSVVTASAGGRTGEVTITVRQDARIALSATGIFFETFSGVEGTPAQTVQVTNAEQGELAGLTLGTTGYSAGATGWLEATLSSGTAPATLTLRPSRADLAPGTYTAVVPVQSAAADNSPQVVTVSYEVRDLSSLFLYIDYSESAPSTGETVVLRAVLMDSTETDYEGVPVSWSITPSGTGTFTPSTVTGAAAQYVAGGFQGSVSVTATVGPLSDTFIMSQNSPSFRRQGAAAPGGTR